MENSPGNRAANVMPSMMNVVANTTASTSLVSPNAEAPSSLAVRSRCEARRCRAVASMISEAKGMTPSPPNCTDTRITHWPNTLQCSVLLTMGMPQVDRADTAV